MYIKSDGNYIRIYLGNQQGNIRMRGKLVTFMEQLPEGFIQVSRSLGINRSYVQSIHGIELVMIDGEAFQIPATARVKVSSIIKKKDI